MDITAEADMSRLPLSERLGGQPAFHPFLIPKTEIKQEAPEPTDFPDVKEEMEIEYEIKEETLNEEDPFASNVCGKIVKTESCENETEEEITYDFKWAVKEEDPLAVTCKNEEEADVDDPLAPDISTEELQDVKEEDPLAVTCKNEMDESSSSTYNSITKGSVSANSQSDKNSTISLPLENHCTLQPGLKKSPVARGPKQIKQLLTSPKEVKQFTCDMCNKTFFFESLLMKHKHIHIVDKHYQCKHCSCVFERADDLKLHLLTHPGERPHKCTVCSYSFRHAYGLKQHMLTHTGEKPHKCTECSYSFSHAGNLKQHMLTHTGERPHKCTLCSYSCRQAGDLKKHMLTHTGEKPHKCTLCSYSCSRAGSLKSHMLTHSGKMKCTICSYSCIQASNLNQHMLKHIGEKPQSYKCTVCSYSCSLAITLRRHMLTHSEEKAHTCGEITYLQALKLFM